MAPIRSNDLQLHGVQKLMPKAMLPLVRLADSFFVAETRNDVMPNPGT